ncbi:hypothetical protein TNCV_2405581 [Trichonephila clavipes]|nr:hypothetical protein TNCV_2405581 [Trichonephila clavipes]
MWCEFGAGEAPNQLKIVQFVCSVPVSNAFVERIFSVMGNVWTDERNRLAVNTVKTTLEVSEDVQDSGWIFLLTFVRMVKTATAGSDVVQSERPIFDDFFQHLWPYIGNNTANVVFQMVKRLWLIRIDQ